MVVVYYAGEMSRFAATRRPYHHPRIRRIAGCGQPFFGQLTELTCNLRSLLYFVSVRCSVRSISRPMQEGDCEDEIILRPIENVGVFLTPALWA